MKESEKSIGRCSIGCVDLSSVPWSKSAYAERKSDLTSVGGSHASTTWEVADSLRGTPYEAPGGNGQRAPSSRTNHSPSWQICGLGDAPWLIDLVPDDERVQAVARQLLGGALRKTQRVRGIYSIFPSRYAPIRSG